MKGSSGIKITEAQSGGLSIDTEEAGYIKSLRDGVSVMALLNETPVSLELTFTWPILPDKPIDFVLISFNRGDSFLAAFRYGTFGPIMIYSENTNPSLIGPLKESITVSIKETDGENGRQYECELKYSE